MSISPTVLVCDDDPIVRRALTAYLADAGFPPPLEAGDGLRAVELACAGGADIALMDIAMPGCDGITATAEIRRRRAGMPVIILTSLGTQDQVSRAQQAGAADVLVKSAPPEEIIGAVRRALSLLAPPAHEAPAFPAARPRPPQPSAPLSRREAQVLALLCEAEPNARIAARLMLSESTVKKYVASVMTKLGAQSRLDAAVRAIGLGLVVIPGDPASNRSLL